MPKFKIEIDKNACIGCGNCVNICPDNFKVEKGKASAVKKEVDDIGCNKEAEDSCPVQAIKITEKE